MTEIAPWARPDMGVRPLVSVIIPAFRAQDTIERCVASLADSAVPLDQTEVIVEGDDGTSYAWLAGLGPHVRPAMGPKARTGPGPTRNRALRRARGDWITYIDADDLVAPKYLDELLDQAGRQGAALAQTHVVRDDQTLLEFGADQRALEFDEWSRTGVSLRGLFHRSVCAEFVDAPAQDILHMVECWLRHGARLEFSSAVYFLTLGDDTVTAQPGFADCAAAAYDQHVEYLLTRYPDAPLLAEAVAFWQAKAKLNGEYQAYCGPLSYYEYLAQAGVDGAGAA